MSGTREGGDAPVDKGTPGRRTRLRRWLVLVPIVYGLWCVVLFAFQGCVVFPGRLRPAPPSEPPKGAHVLSVDLESGGSVEAWFLPARHCDAEHPCPAVMYFHGNAELIDEEVGVAYGYHRLGWSVLMPEYRGFGRSSGSPSQEAIGRDMRAFYELLRERPEVDRLRIVFHGRSLGGAVAADLAARHKPAALILESTFTNAASMAHRMLLPGFLCLHPYRTDETVRSLDVPVVVFHGTHDRVVPVSHGRHLAQLSKAAAYFEYPCGHNDVPPATEGASYWAAIRSALADRASRRGL